MEPLGFVEGFMFSLRGGIAVAKKSKVGADFSSIRFVRAANRVVPSRATLFGGNSGGSMKYLVCAHLLCADEKIARDLGEIEIEVIGPLARGAVAKFDHLKKTGVGTIMDVERYQEPDRVPTVYIQPSLGE